VSIVSIYCKGRSKSPSRFPPAFWPVVHVYTNRSNKQEQQMAAQTRGRTNKSNKGPHKQEQQFSNKGPHKQEQQRAAQTRATKGRTKRAAQTRATKGRTNRSNNLATKGRTNKSNKGPRKEGAATSNEKGRTNKSDKGPHKQEQERAAQTRATKGRTNRSNKVRSIVSVYCKSILLLAALFKTTLFSNAYCTVLNF